MKRATIPVPLPVELVKKLDGARAKLGYRSRNGVIRESIRRFIEEVEEIRVIRLRNVPGRKAKEEIWNYLQKRGRVPQRHSR
ncbi:MAG: ribbon-helix-helix domain-containing protein [Candidatus Hodarchaeaceae archaeon]|nr:ribbon-helix-helix domain-containing protein [Candidatus Hodarchaeaceae archaeon]